MSSSKKAKKMKDYLLERNPKFRKALSSSKKTPGGMSLEAYRKTRKV